MTEIGFGSQRATLSANGGWLDTWSINDNPVLLPRQRLKIGNKERDGGGMHVCFPFYGKAPGRTQLPEHGLVCKMPGVEHGIASDKAEVTYSRLNCLGSGGMRCDITIGAEFESDSLKQHLRVAASDREVGSVRVNPAFRYYFATPQGIASIYSSTTEIVRNPDFGPKFFKFTGQYFVIGVSNGHLLELVPLGAFWDSRKALVCVWRNDPRFVCVDIMVAHPDGNGTFGALLTPEKPIELTCRINVRRR